MLRGYFVFWCPSFNFKCSKEKQICIFGTEYSKRDRLLFQGILVGAETKAETGHKAIVSTFSLFLVPDGTLSPGEIGETETADGSEPSDENRGPGLPPTTAQGSKEIFPVSHSETRNHPVCRPKISPSFVCKTLRFFPFCVQCAPAELLRTTVKAAQYLKSISHQTSCVDVCGLHGCSVPLVSIVESVFALRFGGTQCSVRSAGTDPGSGSGKPQPPGEGDFNFQNLTCDFGCGWGPVAPGPMNPGLGAHQFRDPDYISSRIVLRDAWCAPLHFVSMFKGTHHTRMNTVPSQPPGPRDASAVLASMLSRMTTGENGPAARDGGLGSPRPGSVGERPGSVGGYPEDMFHPALTEDEKHHFECAIW